MAGVVGQNSCSEETVTITSVYFKENLVVNPSSDPPNVVCFIDPNECTDDTQQWKMIKKCGEKQQDLRTFQNVATGGYLCEDQRQSYPNGLKTALGNPREWIVEEDKRSSHSKIFEHPKSTQVKVVKAGEEKGVKCAKLLPWDPADADRFMFDIKIINTSTC